MADFIKDCKNLSSFQIIILGFVEVIILGTLILMLPVSSKSGTFTSFGDALFTATSAVCVTGLVVVDTAAYWSCFGQAVILILIQIGGLGVITVVSLLTMVTGKNISLRQRQTMQNALSAPQLGGMVRLTRFVFFTSFALEGIGALCLMPVFVPKYGAEGIWMSLFHSISAFCNAGFDLMGDKTGRFSSLTSFSGNGYLTFVICFLIIIGGIGFLTWNDIATKRTHFREYRMQTKVILVTTAVLILIPTIVFFFTEFSTDPIVMRISKSFFQAVTPRTAGFNTAELNGMSDMGKTITMVLMLIGGSPGSTAGGMKTTTVALLFVNAIAVFRKKKNVSCFGRRVDDAIVKNASTILIMYVTFAMLSASVISMIEKLPIQACMYESFSAIGTVGLSLGLTPGLGMISHLILVGLMFFGRVGGLTIIFAAFSPNEPDTSRYPMECIMVG